MGSRFDSRHYSGNVGCTDEQERQIQKKCHCSVVSSTLPSESVGLVRLALACNLATCCILKLSKIRLGEGQR